MSDSPRKRDGRPRTACIPAQKRTIVEIGGGPDGDLVCIVQDEEDQNRTTNTVEITFENVPLLIETLKNIHRALKS